jgi:hypothetical protein
MEKTLKKLFKELEENFFDTTVNKEVCGCPNCLTGKGKFCERYVEFKKKWLK